MCVDSAFVAIKYKGPVGMHMVYSPLKKAPHYGMHTFGDIFCVHADDQATLPDLFELNAPVVVPAPAPEPVAEPEPEPVVAAAPRTKKSKKVVREEEEIGEGEEDE